LKLFLEGKETEVKRQSGETGWKKQNGRIEGRDTGGIQMKETLSVYTGRGGTEQQRGPKGRKRGRHQRERQR
jgi:hypothetical protein